MKTIRIQLLAGALAVVLTLATLPVAAQTGPRVALSFDGADHSVSVTDAASLEVTSQFTLECWVWPGRLTNYQELLSKFARLGNCAYEFYLTPGGGLSVDVSGDGTTHDYLTSPMNLLSAGTCSHVATKFGSGELKLYVNGTLVASNTSNVSTIFAGGSSAFPMFALRQSAEGLTLTASQTARSSRTPFRIDLHQSKSTAP